MTYEIVRLPLAGAVDGDGHILEPADLWESYLEPKYRDRAIRVRVDDEGLEFFEFDGQPSITHSRGRPATMGAMGNANIKPGPGVRYSETMAYGACDPVARLDLLDRENLERAVLFPSVGLLWEAQVTSADLTDAYTRAYNRWIADFCRDSRGRLVPVAHLSLIDPEAAAAELERAVRDGCKGAFVSPWTHTKVPIGHPDHDVVWTKAQELGVPVSLHPTALPATSSPQIFNDTIPSPYVVANFGDLIRPALLTFFKYETFVRFPDLRIGVLECQAGWIASLLDRLDTVHATFKDSVHGKAHGREKPSVYFRGNCFISADPDEYSASLIIDYVGAECLQ
jgi:predicted TIM-barrel fold metal-dependent hydrolase